MSALERDTGVRLFQRSARSVVPTDAALVMARHAAKVLTDIEALMAAASKTQDTTSQELRLGIFPSLATYVLPRILRSPAWKDLGIDLRVSVAEPAQTIQGLRTGGDLDVALVYQVGQSGLAWPHTINRQWIGDDNFRVVLPAGWGFRTDAKVAADHLSDMPWIMHHPGTSDATPAGRRRGAGRSGNPAGAQRLRTADQRQEDGPAAAVRGPAGGNIGRPGVVS
jgi:DNA-binding transcriptional LysR family regulator